MRLEITLRDSNEELWNALDWNAPHELLQFLVGQAFSPVAWSFYILSRLPIGRRMPFCPTTFALTCVLLHIRFFARRDEFLSSHPRIPSEKGKRCLRLAAMWGRLSTCGGLATRLLRNLSSAVDRRFRLSAPPKAILKQHQHLVVRQLHQVI